VTNQQQRIKRLKNRIKRIELRLHFCDSARFAGVNNELKKAEQEGQEVKKRRLRDRAGAALDKTIDSVVRRVEDSESDAAAVAAFEALRKLGVDTGAIGRDETPTQQAAVAFEGSGRLAILLGRPSTSRSED
jgi:hypothetical protein